MTTDAETRRYYESLPGKRIGAGLVCTDERGRVLLVRPTYKPAWEVPGGIVEAGESPRAAVAREIAEELGVGLRVGALLVVDWLPVRPPKTEGIMMLFAGGQIDSATTRRFVLPAEELSEWAFVDPLELDGFLPDHMARRLRTALERGLGGAIYLELGLPPA